jgi:hypothetical protein
MIFTRIVPYCIVLTGVVSATFTVEEEEEKPQQLLRKAVSDVVPTMMNTMEHHPEQVQVQQQQKQRQLQILGGGGGGNIFDPCRLIENQFPAGKVSCDCDVALLSGRVNYVCNWNADLCVGGGGSATTTINNLSVCGTPTYSGTLDLLKLTVQNEICIANANAVNGLVSLGDFCIDLSINPRNDKLLTCTATLGGITCNNCIPCRNGGITLQCGNAINGADSNTCSTPIRTVTSLSKKSRTNPKVKIPTPFVPQFNNITAN